jgi:NAD(P)H-dependent flavin oxidoreductase YrpB (nitropropane dioxygenase family)
MRTPICDKLGIEFPIFAFSHCRDVVAAVTNAGGYGVLGALAYEPERLEIELNWIDEHVKGKPYGVDFAMPAKYVGQGGGEQATPEYLASLIPQGHRDFVKMVLDEAGIPELPPDFERSARKAAGLNVDAEGPGQLEVTLSSTRLALPRSTSSISAMPQVSLSAASSARSSTPSGRRR